MHNNTNQPIEIVWGAEHLAPSKIDSSATVVIPWFLLCVTINSGGISEHYQVPELLPKNVQTSGRFSSRITFPVVINNEGLNFENKSGELIPVKKVSECGRT